MFGVGIPEILVILVIALLVIGPDKLPEIAKTLGKALSEFKKVMDGVKSSIEEEQKSVERSVEAPIVKTSLKEKEESLKKDYEEAIEEKNRKSKKVKKLAKSDTTAKEKAIKKPEEA